MELRNLKSFSAELDKIAGVGGALSRGAELLKGSKLPQLARNEKLHSQAAKTIGGLHVGEAAKAFGRHAEEATKVHEARGIAGTAAATGALGVGAAMHKSKEEKTAADLTPEARSELPKKDFAVSAKKSNTGAPAYPIENKAHARAALGFAAMHHDGADLAAVRAKIKAKYPDMLQGKTAMRADVMTAFAKESGALMSSLANGPLSHKMEIGGLGILAAPVAHDLYKSVKAKDKGGIASSGAELGGLGVLAAPAIAALRHH
jgi:hypothetical protein